MKAQHRFIQRYYCEICWAAFTVRRAAVLRLKSLRRGDSAMAASPANRAREGGLMAQRFLRGMLREYPYWMLGHIRLGQTSIALEALADAPMSPRERAAVRLSADAVFRLAAEFNEPPAGRVALEAEFLRGYLDFSERNFSAAAEKFSRILELANSVQLHEEVYRMCLEKYAACQGALGSS